jgi:hypothetical protein
MFCLAIKSDQASQLDPAAHHQPPLTDHANFPFDSPRQSGLCTKASIWPQLRSELNLECLRGGFRQLGPAPAPEFLARESGPTK